MTTKQSSQPGKAPANPLKQEVEAVKALIPINFADGGKGGVGKSLLARTLYQYFLDRKVSVVGVEADDKNPDFFGIYRPNIEKARFSEDEAINEQACSIINLAIEKRSPLVVNLPAGVDDAFGAWLNEYGILDLAKQYNIRLVKWFVCTGEYDSLKSLEVSLQQYGGEILHVVVRNLKYSEWIYFKDKEEIQELIREHKCPVIELPKMNVSVASTILEHRLTFGMARESYSSRRYGVAQQSAVRQFLKAAYEQFDAVNLETTLHSRG